MESATAHICMCCAAHSQHFCLVRLPRAASASLKHNTNTSGACWLLPDKRTTVGGRGLLTGPAASHQLTHILGLLPHLCCTRAAPQHAVNTLSTIGTTSSTDTSMSPVFGQPASQVLVPNPDILS
jgi:hypothetical protein